MDHNPEEVETVAKAIAEAVGSRVFEPLHDTVEHQRMRDEWRQMARLAIATYLMQQS